MKNGFLENLAKFTGKHLRFAKFSRTPFLQNTSATATLLRWGTANSVWKTSDEYPLSRNSNLRSTLQTYQYLFRQHKLSVYVFIGLYSLLPGVAPRVEGVL